MNNTIVELDLIRHGYSCSNLLKKEGYKLTKGLYAKDPVLTDKGIQQATEAGKNLKNIEYDVIVCSNLRRAVETAMFCFQSRPGKIYVVPYISEESSTIPKLLNIDRENQSIGIEGLKAYVKQLKTNNIFDSIEVDFSIIDSFIQFGHNIDVDFDKFMKYVLPRITDKINKKQCRIACVSHHGTIVSHLNKSHSLQMNDYENTEVWREIVEIEKDIDGYLKTIKYLSCKPNSKVCQIYKPTRIDHESKDRCYAFHENYPKDQINYSHEGGSRYFSDYLKYKEMYHILKNKQN